MADANDEPDEGWEREDAEGDLALTVAINSIVAEIDKRQVGTIDWKLAPDVRAKLNDAMEQLRNSALRNLPK